MPPRPQWHYLRWTFIGVAVLLVILLPLGLTNTMDWVLAIPIILAAVAIGTFAVSLDPGATGSEKAMGLNTALVALAAMASCPAWTSVLPPLAKAFVALFVVVLAIGYHAFSIPNGSRFNFALMMALLLYVIPWPFVTQALKLEPESIEALALEWGPWAIAVAFHVFGGVIGGARFVSADEQGQEPKRNAVQEAKYRRGLATEARKLAEEKAEARNQADAELTGAMAQGADNVLLKKRLEQAEAEALYADRAAVEATEAEKAAVQALILVIRERLTAAEAQQDQKGSSMISRLWRSKKYSQMADDELRA